MVRESEVREGEITVDMPPARDAGLVFIGRIRTPWNSRLETPRQGRHDGPVCRLEIFEPWVPAIKGVDFYENLEVIYWLHQSRRDLVLQSPKNNQKTRGTFSLRSPVRPNPIGTSIVKLVGDRGQRHPGARPRLPRRNAAARHQARPLRIHAAGAAAARGFRDGVRPPSARIDATRNPWRVATSHDCPRLRFAPMTGYETTPAPRPAWSRCPPAPSHLPCGSPAATARRRHGAASRACAGGTRPARRRAR